MEEKRIKVQVLGSGTSTGVPVIGCDCATCHSNQDKNKRLRSSILISGLSSKQNIVVDTTPDFRQQALRVNLKQLHGVLYTHTHADHCHGFDDLRAFYFFNHNPIQIYLDHKHAEDIKSRFDYAFKNTGYIGTTPQVVINEIVPSGFKVGAFDIDPVWLPHGPMQSVGFRIGPFAYATDFERFPPEAIERWRGKVEVMIASGLRFRPHPSHSNIEGTLKLFDLLNVKKGFISHLSHEVDFERDKVQIPEPMELAYDGLAFDVDL